jgi:hypothetical protein
MEAKFSCPLSIARPFITPFFRWYDLWVGAYYDRQDGYLYVCPLPMVGIKIRARRDSLVERRLISKMASEIREEIDREIIAELKVSAIEKSESFLEACNEYDKKYV